MLTPIGIPIKVNTKNDTMPGYGAPATAFLPNGQGMTVWFDFGFQAFFGQRFQVEIGPIGETFKLNHDTYSDWPPVVAALKDSQRFVTLWSTHRGDELGYDVYGRLWDINANPIGEEFTVNTQQAGRQVAPDIAALCNGYFIATWLSTNEGVGQGSIDLQVFDANGYKTGCEFNVAEFTDHSESLYNPKLIPLSNGNLAITWARKTGIVTESSNNIYAQIFTQTMQPLTQPIIVNNLPPSSVYLAASKGCTLYDGGFVLSWPVRSNSNTPVASYTQVLDANGNKRLSTETQIEPAGYSDSVSLSFCRAFSANEFLFAWSPYYYDNIYAQWFNANGIKQGSIFPLFQDNQYPKPSLSILLPLSRDRFSATWYQGIQGIFTQSFLWEQNLTANVVYDICNTNTLQNGNDYNEHTCVISSTTRLMPAWSWPIYWLNQAKAKAQAFYQGTEFNLVKDRAVPYIQPQTDKASQCLAENPMITSQSRTIANQLPTNSLPSDESSFVPNASTLTPNLPNPTLTLALAMTTWHIAKQAWQGFSAYWQESKADSLEEVILAREQAELHQRVIKLEEQAQIIYQKQDYAHDYLRWQIEDLQVDLAVGFNDKESLESFKGSLAAAEQRVAYRNNSLDSSRSSSTFTTVHSFFKRPSACQSTSNPNDNLITLVDSVSPSSLPQPTVARLS